MRFARDRWYTKEGQRQLQQRARSESMGTRKVISLTLLLLMILVAMQQLGDPQKFEPAFRSIGLSQSSQPRLAHSAASASPKNSDSLNGAAEKKEVNASFEDEGNSTLHVRQTQLLVAETSNIDLFMQMWLRLLESASPEVINELGKNELGLIHPIGENPDVDRTATIKTSKAFLEWLTSAQSRVEQWQEAYRLLFESTLANEPTDDSDLSLGMTFVTQWFSWASLHREGVSRASSALDSDLRSGLQLALDRRLLGLFRDASPWRTQERPALARTLHRAKSMIPTNESKVTGSHSSPAVSPLIEVTSLMKQTNDYRGQVVRMLGRPVTNPESAVQEVDGWGRFQYDIVWFRPSDASQQPVCVYSVRTPIGGWPTIAPTPASKAKSSQQKGSTGIDAVDAPLAELSGILVKRLAYPSQRGVDVAPVLIAFDVRWLSVAKFDQDVTRGVALPRVRFPRWIEPGEQAANLQLLRDIFASDMETLSDEDIQSKLTDTVLSIDIDSEIPQLGQILYQLPRVAKPLSAAIATNQKIGPAKLDSFYGWVRSIDAISLPKTFSTSGEPVTIYRLLLEPNSDHLTQEATQVAFVNQVPMDWKSAPKLSQPISLSGMYWETSTDRAIKKCWIADHVNWSWPWLDESTKASELNVNGATTSTRRTASISSEMFIPSIEDDWQLLGAVGFDLSRVDQLRRLRVKPISAQESSAFYSLIDCADRISTKTARASSAALSAIDCLQEQNAPIARRVRAEVQIVRATRILVSDEYDQAALDGEAYYELDGLANMGDLSIQLKSPDGKGKILFQGEFPITLISKQIPMWLGPSENSSITSTAQLKDPGVAEVDEAPTVWYPRMTVEIEGIFYRLWSFTTAQTSALDNTVGIEKDQLRQIGPLVAVMNWKKSSSDSAAISKRSFVLEIATAIGFTAIGIYVLYRLNQSAKRRKA